MKEELLDDTIHIEEESYLYLEELKQFSAVLTKVVIVLCLIVGLDIFQITRSLLTAHYPVSFIQVFFNLLIDGILAFCTHAIWLQKKEQEEAPKKELKDNETAFLVRSYNIWYLVGLIFVVFIIRTLIFIAF